VERVAAADSADAAPASADCAVLSNRLDEIGAATGGKPALAADQVAQRELINPNAGD